MTSLTAAMWILMEAQLLLYLSITSSNISAVSASINGLNIHPVGFFFFFYTLICFHLLSFVAYRSASSSSFSPPNPKNKHTNASHTQKRTGENRAPRKCNTSVFNIEVYKIRAEMGSMAICLFIYFIRGGGSAYQCLYLGGLGRRIRAHLIWKIMLCMAILLYIMAIWDQGSFTMCHTSG